MQYGDMPDDGGMMMGPPMRGRGGFRGGRSRGTRGGYYYPGPMFMGEMMHKGIRGGGYPAPMVYRGSYRRGGRGRGRAGFNNDKTNKPKKVTLLLTQIGVG